MLRYCQQHIENPAADINADTVEVSNNIDPLALTKFETVEELEQLLTVFCAGICKCVNNSAQIPLHIRAINYIKQNCSNQNFSVNTMSDSLGVSAAHLSRSFKENMGATIADYIRDNKIEQAKDLLSQTSKPIRRIVYDLGYFDVSSFIRSFKAIVGVTPGEYRNNSKTSKVSR